MFETISSYYQMFLDAGDPRVKEWPLVKSPLPTLAICLSYAFAVKVLGPKLMKDRQPYNLRGAMIVYNFLMVILSSFIFLYAGVVGWFGKYNWKCQPVDYSDAGMAAAYGAYIYYLSKFVEFSDTIFFVLRKKFDHISRLHVIHHGIMPMSVWWGMKFVPGGHATFFGFLNSFVHIPMYLYYFLAAFGPHMNKYLFWKKYMTAFQMVQFVAIFAHSFQLLFRDCNFPKGFAIWIGAHGVLFWFLFSDFYTKTYNKNSEVKALDFSTGFKNGVANGKINGSININEKKENGVNTNVKKENGHEMNNNVMNGNRTEKKED